MNDAMADPKPSVSSTALSTPADEYDAVSSAVLSALRCVESYDGDEKVNTAPEMRAPIIAEANEGLQSGSRLPKEASLGSSSEARQASNVDLFRREFDRDERTSASEMEAATAPPALCEPQAPVPAYRGDEGGFTSVEETLVTEDLHVERPSASEIAVATAPPTLYDLQGVPVPTHRDDEGGFTTMEAALVIKEAEATLVTEDPNTVTESPVIAVTEDPHITTERALVPEPLPMRKCWPSSKFQWVGGLILCLIVVGIAIGVAVGVSGGSGDGGEPAPSSSLAPSTAPSFASRYY
jgi:hypothetical protein